MNWSNVKLILMREMRDQMRDRRTLFMIAVLPLMLYPLLGMSFFRMTQFMRGHSMRVLVIGAPEGEAFPPLVVDGRFAPEWLADAESKNQFEVTEAPRIVSDPESSDPVSLARRELRTNNYEVLVYFPPNFAEDYNRFRHWLIDSGAQGQPPPLAGAKMPDVEVYPNVSKDSARQAQHLVTDVLDRWRDEIGRRNLTASHVAPAAAKPFAIRSSHEGPVAGPVWSKVLPFVLLIWALTGAFYPAVDLCAGEKERGTLETLLCSPAERIEIVWGKLLTIMMFSIATAVLNLLSLSVTGALVLSQMPNFGPPPLPAMLWLLVALLPMSALFSALCLALAALARSTKEGQYYLMPLVLITMPLTILPMAPGVELNLGYSLIPVTGVVLLLRSVLEGNYLATLPYLPIVIAVTLGCCGMAIRWATSQFNTESVLFRESERLDLGLWLRHLRREREATPTFGEAIFCGVLILLANFFLAFIVPQPTTFLQFAGVAMITIFTVVALPALLMTAMFTRSPAQTLLLKKPPLVASLAAVLLAVALHPAVNVLQWAVSLIYPQHEKIKEQLQQIQQLLNEPGTFWVSLFALAVVPAVCEELAFRGFILSGLRRGGHKWTAILLSSVLFAAAHSILQQSVISCLLGLVIGFIAIQTGSLLPCVLFHMTHNGLLLTINKLAPAAADQQHWLRWLIRDPEGEGSMYHWQVVACSLVASAVILAWFHRLPYVHTREEKLQEALDHQTAVAGSGS